MCTRILRLWKKTRKRTRTEKIGKTTKIIAITSGDPQGIGPEIIEKSLTDYTPRCGVVIFGQLDNYKDKSVQVISDINQVQDQGVYFYNIRTRFPANAEKSEPSYEFVKTAVDFALKKKVHALVTAPISKEKWLRAGVPFKGHTELLAKTAGVKNYSMFFWSENLKVALYTIHIPLKDIFQYIRGDEILRYIRFIDRELFRLFRKKFTFLVSGLNPHAGEDGFLGTEEKDVIIPVVHTLKSEIIIDGPYPPDTVFLKARDIRDSVVISWYHDQGLIAFKLLNLHSGVNMTLGLPYIRTAPDHGTAYDIVGKEIANPSSMKQAIRLAEYLLKLK
ncbi:MAG: 4-hydroxythreonine-4-phosphate dehydrogenase PdxA [Candidatus Aminicenantes bacterium]|nr:MAG: 4-hydroxythreonine-4-phosphate dehydrogenase PdxA [Candidatus Aminicenantes bacterium]